MEKYYWTNKELKKKSKDKMKRMLPTEIIHSVKLQLQVVCFVGGAG